MHVVLFYSIKLLMIELNKFINDKSIINITYSVLQEFSVIFSRRNAQRRTKTNGIPSNTILEIQCIP